MLCAYLSFLYSKTGKNTGFSPFFGKKGDVKNMDFVAYNEILICEKPIRNEIVAGKKIGYTFEIRYPSYRGCYLSCIEDLKFEIDGQEIAKEKSAVSLNGKEFTISDLPELNHEYWYVMKPATIRVQQIGGIAPGDHTLRVYMKHRVPYTGYFGQYLTLISDRAETLAAEQ